MNKKKAKNDEKLPQKHVWHQKARNVYQCQKCGIWKYDKRIFRGSIEDKSNQRNNCKTLTMLTTEIIKKEYPNLIITGLNGGCNIEMPDDSIITVWFKKCKFKSNKEKEWHKFSDATDFLKVLSNKGNKASSKSRHKSKPTNVKEFDLTGGVQMCIDHINAKAMRIESRKGTNDNAMAVMLKTLALELEQFL